VLVSSLFLLHKETCTAVAQCCSACCGGTWEQQLSTASSLPESVSPTSSGFVCGSSAGQRRTSKSHRRPCELPARHPGQSMEIRLALWATHLQEEDLTRSPITKTCLVQLARCTVCAVCVCLSYICALHTRRGLHRIHSSGSPRFTPISAHPTPASHPIKTIVTAGPRA
jgi:hypothetical protein